MDCQSTISNGSPFSHGKQFSPVLTRKQKKIIVFSLNAIYAIFLSGVQGILFYPERIAIRYFTFFSVSWIADLGPVCLFWNNLIRNPLFNWHASLLNWSDFCLSCFKRDKLVPGLQSMTLRKWWNTVWGGAQDSMKFPAGAVWPDADDETTT